MFPFWIGAFITFFLDRLTKIWVFKWEGTVYPVTSFFNLVKVWNKGVAFGLLNESNPFFQFLLIILSLGILIVVYLWAKNSDKTTKIILGILWGGGIGNLTDRFLYSAVLDFVDLHLGGYHWPAFNLADVGITFSIVMLIFIKLFVKK